MSNIGGANIKLGADESGVISSINNARKHFALFTREINSNVAQAYKKADAEQKVFRGGLTRLGDEFVSLGQKMAVVGTLPALFAAGKAYKDFADIQRLEKGLSLYGSTLDDIRRLAKEPNIGVFDGAKSLVGLRAAKIDAELAERAVKSFANAIAAAGGNASDLEPALLNLKQFKATKNINQVDLRQLSGRIPQAMDIIQKQFGTLDTEKLNKIGIDKFIEGFVSGLEKIPKVAGGAGVAMEQVADSFTFFSGTIGEGIEKAFNVSDKINSLAGFLDSLATNFKTLTPEGQKAILMFGGLAVVIPPVLVAVGTLIKLWPLLAGAFATISWPVVAIGATVAAISGLIAIMPLLNNHTAEFNKQSEMVAGFATKLDPLVAQYDALKEKTNLSTEEQKKLKDLTEQIAALVPTAVKGWDSYGNAIDINTDKAKTYTAEQKKLLSAMQATRRESLLSEIYQNTRRRNELQTTLGSGKQTTKVHLGMGVYSDQTHILNNDEVKKAATELAVIQQKDAQNRKELLNIGGLDAYKKDVVELKSLIKQRIQLRAEYAEALKGNDFNKSEDLRLKSNSVAEAIKERKDRITALGPQVKQGKIEADASIPKAIEKIPPAAKAAGDALKDAFETENHKKYLKLLADEKKNLEEIREIAADIKIIRGTGNSAGLDASIFGNSGVNEFQASLGRKKAAEALKGRSGDILGIASIGAKASPGTKDSIEDSMGSSLEGYQQKMADAKSATDNLNAALASSFKETGVSVSVGFGEMLGDLASGVGGVETFSQRLLGALGGMLKEMGKALIAAGIGGIALKKLMKVPALAIPAGIALVALGQTLNNSVSKSVGTATRTRLAKGGAVFGPTQVIVGDNPNAKNDPELVAPYSKVHASFQKIATETMGRSGGGYEQIKTVVRGEDIEIIHKRVQQRNNALGV